MLVNLKELGRICKLARAGRGYFQRQVAEDTGYTIENVSAFENGRNDNSRLLLWYFEHGLTYDDIKECIYNG